MYGIDVGYGQVAWKLRQDVRLVLRERTNIRHLKPERSVWPGRPLAQFRGDGCLVHFPDKSAALLLGAADRPAGSGVAGEAAI